MRRFKLELLGSRSRSAHILDSASRELDRSSRIAIRGRSKSRSLSQPAEFRLDCDEEALRSLVCWRLTYAPETADGGIRAHLPQHRDRGRDRLPGSVG